ncbi:MAG: response regulator [Acidobacteriaceae bacterium]
MGLFQTESPLRNGTGSTSTVGHQLESSTSSQGAPIVFIVDGDESFRESLAPLIAREGWRPETFKSAEDFLRRRLELVASCLILEVSLPGLSGLDLQKHLAAERPGIPIIFLTAQCDLAVTVQAMKAGAAEFFTKPFREEELLSAMRGALTQSRVAVAHAVENRALRKCYASLTRRQRQVMALVSSGLLNKQVGGELGISEITVKAHRGQVMRKMRADSLAGLVRMAGKLGVATGLGMPMFRHDGEGGWSAERELHGFLSSVMSLVPPGQAKSA